MAKRFFDTEKFSDEWYRRLPLKYKVLWDYLLCKCDHAGIVKIDLDLASFFIGETLEDDCIDKYFSERIIQIKGFKYFIPKFITFQYGELGTSNPHKAVLKRLKDEGINVSDIEKGNPSLTLAIPLRYPTDTLKDQDKDQDKVKDLVNTEIVTDDAPEKNLPEIQPQDFRNPKDLQVTPDKLIQLFNDKLAGKGKIKHCRGLSGVDIENFKTITSYPDFQQIKTWEEIFDLAGASEFTQGRSTNFVVTLNWLLRHENALKVLNGQYGGGGDENAVKGLFDGIKDDIQEGA